MSTILENLLNRRSELQVCRMEIQAAYEVLRECFRQGGKLLVCGNGGSAADSEHIVAELMKGYRSKRQLGETEAKGFYAAFPADAQYLMDNLQGALPAISLVSQPALLTAYANDVASDMAFAQQVYGYGRPGDVLLGISTSGNSKNVVHAAQVGRVLGLHTLCLTGEAGGALKAVCESAICVPAFETPRVQELHEAVYHTLCEMLEEEFFEDRA
ncbi:MAG TPA: SIS domain-containing protein [Anaerolineales bacterium]